MTPTELKKDMREMFKWKINPRTVELNVKYKDLEEYVDRSHNLAIEQAKAEVQKVINIAIIADETGGNEATPESIGFAIAQVLEKMKI